MTTQTLTRSQKLALLAAAHEALRVQYEDRLKAGLFITQETMANKMRELAEQRGLTVNSIAGLKVWLSALDSKTKGAHGLYDSSIAQVGEKNGASGSYRPPVNRGKQELSQAGIQAALQHTKALAEASRISYVNAIKRLSPREKTPAGLARSRGLPELVVRSYLYQNPDVARMLTEA